MYGGDFPCPAVHVFRSSASILDNTISGNTGDIIRAKGSLINVQRNTADSQLGFAGNVSHHDDNYGNKYGSVAYFSGSLDRRFASLQHHRITCHRSVGTNSVPWRQRTLPRQHPLVGCGVSVRQDECLQLPGTVALPPAGMPLALELVKTPPSSPSPIFRTLIPQ